ncbi:TIR domain-containing protein [Sphingobium chlorophenolicum]|uniref:TIR domain-containing protein n=1 Tax=Sphingobium chlorophenolicum TaxID=46429 RepID=UPI0009DD3668|nr:TIR domain-containing protein [Sphingobium chlorophenolicum]
MADQTKNVFISHVHEDDAGLGKIKTLLAKNGMTIRDSSINSSNPNNAKSEAYIKSDILAPQINWAGTLVVYVSPATKDSKWVNWEIEYAHKMGKRIVGVWEHGTKDCDLPEALNNYADAVVGWHGNSIIDAINGQGDVWEKPDGGSCDVRPITRHPCG